ncbi:MAG: cardiolipin synthase [Verrucomicrobiales bacterium]
MLTDARGSSKFGSEAKDRLIEAGCKVESFHRWRVRNLGKFNVRDHRKVVVIDGKIAFVGGHCIADYWYNREDGRPPNRDVSAHVTGPIVGAIQSAFFENWQEVTGELFVDESTFPELEACGEVTTHLAFVRADGCPSSVQILHYMGIADRKTTEELDAIFQADMADCEERKLEDWNARPLWKRMVDRFHYLFNEQF